MVTIVTRATKGSALTWTEGDANITNLNSGKLENVVEDLSPQLGGDLDVAGKSIVSASNGNINITPNGSGNISLSPATGKIILGAADWPTTTGSAGQVLTTSGGTGVLTWETPSAGGGGTLNDLTDVVITAAATGEVLQYNGTAWVDIAPSTLTVGVASTVALTADNTTAATNYPLFANAATGNLSPRTDTGFTYNPSTGVLTATAFAGAHNGTVGATTPSTGVFTGATIKGANPFNAPRLLLDNTTQYSTAWTTTGIGIVQTGNTIYRDTSSTGTVNDVYINVLGSANIERANIGAFSNATTLYVAAPVAGTNTTITNPALAIKAEGPVRITGNLGVDGGSVINGALVGTVGATTANTGNFTTCTATTFVGDISSTTGTAAAATNATNATNTTNVAITNDVATATAVYPTWVTTTTGNLPQKVSNTKLSFVPSTGVLTATSFTGAGTFTSGTINSMTIGATTASTGKFTSVEFKNPIEPVFALGTTGGTIAPDCANGSVQSITLNAALTINAFTNPTAGESLTLIINGGTAYTSITSTMKFAGGIKTLTGTASCIDILTVYYDGTTYFASLGKGFA